MATEQTVLTHEFSLQSSQGLCDISGTTVSVIDDCDVPEASFIKQLIFFFSPTSTRRMVHKRRHTHIKMWSLRYSLCKGANFNFVLYVQFCGRTDKTCEWLVCRLGNLEAGREVTIQLEANLNPAVLRQAPVTHSHAGD